MITGGGFDYGIFSSSISDLTMATGEPGEFFEFATEYFHRKSIWFEFNITTGRSIKIKLEAAPGSVLSDPKHSGVTLYSPSTCLPGASNRLGSIISSGELERYCTIPGTYRIQVTAIDNISASVFVNLILSCPFDPIYPEVATYDCPDKAFVFNSGMPLPQTSSTGIHAIECHSIEDPSEYNCLPLLIKPEFLKSAWYVFTTGAVVDFLSFDFPVGSQTIEVGYRLLEGNVRVLPFSSLPQIECGLAEIGFTVRYIEFPCVLKPNTTYSLAVIFHKDFEYNSVNIRALQRGMAATGWPKPLLPPVVATNQLGVLPMQMQWDDRFDCTSFIRDNICPPANPASGLVVIGSGNTVRSYDLATWATFTLSTDAHVKFQFSFYHSNSKYHTRIFSKTLGNSCPSPDLASDLYYEFSGFEGEVKCLPMGDYSIQVLSSSNDTFPSTINYKDSWNNGYLGTRFTVDFNIIPLPSIGLFRLDAAGEFNDINGLNPLQNNVYYPSTPAVFICENTVLPAAVSCQDVDKAIYREVNIGDADGDGLPDEGLLRMTGLMTHRYPDTSIFYQFFQGDANQLATAAGTHIAGQFIPGLTDYAGFCLDRDHNWFTPIGIDTFCACVTSGTYTLASLGDVEDVGFGDTPVFKFNKYKTIHDSRTNAELIVLGPVPGNYSSNPDVFSCLDNPSPLPACGSGRKLIYREFYLPDSSVMTITENGNAGNLLSLFSGRASNLADDLTLIADCFDNTIFIDLCTKFPPGWYTVISFGNGPNFTDNKVLSPDGDPGDVGLSTRITIALDSVVTPNYNRPSKAYQAGVTDWITPPPANPNATTGLIYYFPSDTFCLPDTPFITNNLATCGPGYNRVAFYVFEITKPSFVQIRNVAQSFYTEVFPFDVNAQPGDLLTVPPVYQCVSTGRDYRQICDLPPGKYTIAIFANDGHWGLSVTPSIYVDEAALSRFDHVWNAYDFDLIPTTNMFVNGRALDTHPTLTGQAPSRDKFYCTTGATATDPTETRCRLQLNPLVYAQPNGIPKPQFLNGIPLPPLDQPWRNLWYTFKLSGSGICTLRTDVLGGITDPPLIAVYESNANGTIPWATLQASLNNPGNSIIPGLKLLDEDVDLFCDALNSELVFAKSGCIRDSVRYYVVLSFDADRIANLPNMPNQAISLSIKYFPKPTFVALYDEWPTANVVNGLGETVPPYTSVKLAPGNTFMSPDFSLLCYTKNVTDPPGCNGTGKSAWFKFEIAESGHLFTALQEVGIPNGWYAGMQDMSVWRETNPGGPLVEQLPINYINNPGHEWLEGCIDPGTYYLLVRNCSSQIDTIQTYRVVLNLVDPPGDFCYNAIPVDIIDFNPVTGVAIIDCHTIGTDIGEMVSVGNTCFPIVGRKTTWFHAVINAGPMVDLKFQLGENFTGGIIDLSDLEYRILAGTCGAMTPIACSAGNINLTLNCLGPGDYYVQVSLPEKAGANSLDVEGTLSLTVTATASNPQFCTDPVDPSEVNADFTYSAGCQTITFFNLSSAGINITYLWEFPDGTSTEANPTWTPPPGDSTYSITLTVTNTFLNKTSSITLQVLVSAPFASYSAMPDTIICNSGPVTLDATVMGATYLWDDNSTGPRRVTSTEGIFWVIINIGGCEKRDTAIVTSINAQRAITPTLCPGTSITVGNQIFDNNNPAGTLIIPNAHPSGCDSILTVNLSFYSPAVSQLSNTICEGEVFAFGNQNLTQSGIYTDTLVAAHGCDSISTLMLTVTPRLTLSHVAGGCIGVSLPLSPMTSGPTYAWSNGVITDTLDVNTPGTYTVSVSDLMGCIISVETFAVTFGILSSPSVSIPDPVCPDSDVLLTATGSSGFYQWFDAAVGGTLLGTGSTLLISNVQNNTIIYVEALQVGMDTCVSLREPIQILLSIEPIQTEVNDTVICAGNSVTLPWGEVVMPQLDASFLHSWQYAISGCDSLILMVNVNIVAIQPLSLPSVLELQFGDSVLLVPQIDFLPDSIAWSPAEGLSCTNCLQPWANPTQSTDYLLSIWSPEGCLVSAMVHLDVNRDVRIYIPNVFTPNEDGVNDIFTVYANREVRSVLSLMVYDRWGNGVWQDHNFIPDGTTGWDGFSRGKPMLSGVYVWLCEIELIDGTKEVLSGDVTLVR